MSNGQKVGRTTLPSFKAKLNMNFTRADSRPKAKSQSTFMASGRINHLQSINSGHKSKVVSIQEMGMEMGLDRGCEFMRNRDIWFISCFEQNNGEYCV